MYRSSKSDLEVINLHHCINLQTKRETGSKNFTTESHLSLLLRITSATIINPLTPNDHYSGHTAPLTSKVAFYIFIQQIYVLNILNMVYTLCFSSSKCSLFHNASVFGSCITHILTTECAKIKKNNSGAKRLTL
jgi:hypothetical protein